MPKTKRKYFWVRWNEARIKKLYRAGTSVAKIARLIGFPRGCGQNRVHRLLQSAGLK